MQRKQTITTPKPLKIEAVDTRFMAVLGTHNAWSVWATDGSASLEVLRGLGGKLAFEICDHLNNKVSEVITREAVWLCWLILPKWEPPSWVKDPFGHLKPLTKRIKVT